MEDSTKFKYDLSIVVACYNEEPYLQESIDEIESVMNRTKYSYQLIFIDDGSQDETRSIIEKICQNKDNYSYYFHPKNIGRGGTVKEGLMKSQSQYAGFLDIDLEVHARYIPSMIRVLEEGFDVATAHRYYDMTQVFQLKEIVRNFLSYVYRLIVKKYLKLNVCDSETGYKFFKKETMDAIIGQTKNNGWFWDTEVMALAQFSQKKIREIPCLFLRRKDKKSTVKIFKDVRQYLSAIKRFRQDCRQGFYKVGK